MQRKTISIAMCMTIACFTGTRAQEKADALNESLNRHGPKPPSIRRSGEEIDAAGMKTSAGNEKVVWPGMTRTGAVVLPNGWSLKPAGRQIRLGDLPVQIAVHPTEPVLAILHAGYGEHEVVTASATSGKIIGRVSLPASFSGLIWSHDGKRLFVGGGFDDKIYRFECADGLLSGKTVFSYPEVARMTAGASRRVPAGLALSKDGKTLYVANAFGHSLARFDADSGAFRDEIELEADSYPYGLALDEAHKRLYVSLWSKAKVAVVDMETFKQHGQLTTEEHPNEMLLAHGGKILFVANANRNTVTVIDTEAGKAIETIGTAIDPKAPAGQHAEFDGALARRITALRVQRQYQRPDGRQRERPRRKRTRWASFPTGWYPTSVRLSRDGKSIYVSNGKGASSRANRDGPRPGFAGGRNPTRNTSAACSRGRSRNRHARTAADGCLFPDGL